MALKVKRVYEAATKTDGMRILVDRLWPRGIAKEKAKVFAARDEEHNNAVALKSWLTRRKRS
jgi:uncharacterized protein YeaO (DUF488 family)